MSLGRNFHKALAASGFANLADGVMWVALPLLAVQLTRSPLLIAGVTVAARAPWLVLSLVAGALADRLDRRQTMSGQHGQDRPAAGGPGAAADVASWYGYWWQCDRHRETLSTPRPIAAAGDLDAPTDRANSRLFGRAGGQQFVGRPLGGLLAATACRAFGPAAAYLVGRLPGPDERQLPGGRGRA